MVNISIMSFTVYKCIGHVGIDGITYVSTFQENNYWLQQTAYELVKALCMFTLMT